MAQNEGERDYLRISDYGKILLHWTQQRFKAIVFAQLL